MDAAPHQQWFTYHIQYSYPVPRVPSLQRYQTKLSGFTFLTGHDESLNITDSYN